jgi:hypothetical protein
MLFQRFFPFAILAVLGACGGSTVTIAGLADGGGADGASDDTSDDVAPDVIPPADGPFACGATTCDPTAFCINPCCGGFLPACEPAEDGGGCPSETHRDNTCNQPGPPCRPDPCTPPPPFCALTPSCGPDGTGFGGMVMGHQVGCVCG